MYKSLALIPLIYLVICQPQRQELSECRQLSLLPMPKEINCNIKNAAKVMVEPCDIIYELFVEDRIVQEGELSHLAALIEHQQYKSFKCMDFHIGSTGQGKPEDYVVKIKINDPTLIGAMEVEHESYSAHIQQKSAILESHFYPGMVRALQTFIQSITCERFSPRECYLMYLPISVKDSPSFQHRGLKIDSSSHYLPIHLLYETVDALMYNKMNVLHWKIVGASSFPLFLPGLPELAGSFAFSHQQIYETEQVTDLIRYAMIRGVRIIPEINLNEGLLKWNQIYAEKITCGKDNSMLDLTLHTTYDLMEKIMKEVIKVFPDPYIHLGETLHSNTCLSNLTQFKEKESVGLDEDIDKKIMEKQVKIVRGLQDNKKCIFYIRSNQEIQKFEEGTVLHWRDEKTKLNKEKAYLKKIPAISSSNKDFSLGSGVGDVTGLGKDIAKYQIWLTIYDSKEYAGMNGQLGGEVTLDGGLSNKFTHHTKIWIRSSSFAERMWGSPSSTHLEGFIRRITTHERLMNKRGIPTAPATAQYCQFDAEPCVRKGRQKRKRK